MQMIICERLVNPDCHLQEASCLSLVVVCSWSLFVVGLCLSLVVVCRWSLFVAGGCLSLVVYCRWSLFVVGHCLSLVVVLRWSLFFVGLCLLLVVLVKHMPTEVRIKSVLIISWSLLHHNMWCTCSGQQLTTTLHWHRGER